LFAPSLAVGSVFAFDYTPSDNLCVLTIVTLEKQRLPPHLLGGAHLVAPAKKPLKNANPPIGSPEWYDAVEDRSEARSEMVFELYQKHRLGPEPPVGSPEWYEAIEERSDETSKLLYEARQARKRAQQKKIAAAAKSAAKAVATSEWLEDMRGRLH
jgi:hypothetical protein